MTKTRALTLTLILTMTGTLVACGGNIRAFVEAAKPPPSGPVTRAPASPSFGPMGLRISPGAVDATAGPLRMKAGVGVRRQTVTMGADRRARVGFGRTGVSF